MNNDFKKAKEQLLGDMTIVLVNGDNVLTSTKNGIAPMMEFISNNINLEGYSLADRIVGKAVALLFAKSKIKNVFAKVLSEKAIPILDKYNIAYEYEILVPTISNRAGNGTCPMEMTVANTDDPNEAYNLLKAKIQEMKNLKNKRG